MTDAVLEARGLVVLRDGRRTLDALDLSVHAGTVYALLGGNGAGKTTTLNAFLGFVTPSGGRVCVAGLPAGARTRRHLAYLPENVALYGYLDGIENLRYFCAIAGIRLGAGQARQLLEQAGLQPEAAGRRVSSYSKGMRQKVGLAIAQAREARAMLLDEPTSGLDPASANDLADRIRRVRDAGMAVLMATHDLVNARQVADRIGILQHGRLVHEFDAAAVGHAELESTYLAHARGAAAA